MTNSAQEKKEVSKQAQHFPTNVVHSSWGAGTCRNSKTREQLTVGGALGQKRKP